MRERKSKCAKGMRLWPGGSWGSRRSWLTCPGLGVPLEQWHKSWGRWAGIISKNVNAPHPLDYRFMDKENFQNSLGDSKSFRWYALTIKCVCFFFFRRTGFLVLGFSWVRHAYVISVVHAHLVQQFRQREGLLRRIQVF